MTNIAMINKMIVTNTGIRMYNIHNISKKKTTMKKYILKSLTCITLKNSYSNKQTYNKEASRLYAELLLCVCLYTEHI